MRAPEKGEILVRVQGVPLKTNSMYTDLSDFISQTTVTRQGRVAEIVTGVAGPEHGPDAGKPIRLIGFVTEADLSDFEICEQGYNYFLRLSEILKSV